MRLLFTCAAVLKNGRGQFEVFENGAGIYFCKQISWIETRYPGPGDLTIKKRKMGSKIKWVTVEDPYHGHDEAEVLGSLIDEWRIHNK